MVNADGSGSSPGPTERLEATSGTDRGKKRSRGSTDTGKEEDKKHKKHKDEASSPILKDDSEWGNILEDIGRMAGIEDNDEDDDNDATDHGVYASKTRLSSIRKAKKVTRNVAATSVPSLPCPPVHPVHPAHQEAAHLSEQAQKEAESAAKATEDAEAAAEAQRITDCKESAKRAAAVNEEPEAETAATMASASKDNEDTEASTAAVGSEEGKIKAKEAKASRNVDYEVESSSRSTVESVASGRECSSPSECGSEGSDDSILSNINVLPRPSP